MNKIIIGLGVFCVSALWTSCVITEAEIDDNVMLDGNIVFDSSSYLVSDSFPAPTDSIKNIPVIIAAHGFSATTFEWLDFSNFRDSTGGFLLSRVLLGGHGRSYEAFKNSTWKEWQRPIIEEYRRLSELGFTNISLAGSSTGGALIVELLAEGAFRGLTPPRQIFMIDAIVVPGDKLLSIIDLVGFLMGNTISHSDSLEAQHWYTNRPQEALNELLDVITKIRHDLEDGILLPDTSTEFTIYKTRGDEVADPISGLLMYKGIRKSDGTNVELRYLNSDRHVFTRSAGREDTWTAADRALQMSVFTEMRDKVIN